MAFAAAIAMTSGMAIAANPEVGGAAMFENKNIIGNAVDSKDHTTLVAAVKAAGLVETLSGAGPFTVFAPTNQAFAALPAGTVETLLKPGNKDQLTRILICHVAAASAISDTIMRHSPRPLIRSLGLVIHQSGSGAECLTGWHLKRTLAFQTVGKGRPGCWSSRS